MQATLDIANLFPLVKRKTTTKSKNKIKTKHTRLYIELEDDITIEEQLLLKNNEVLDITEVCGENHDYETIIDGIVYKLLRSWLKFERDKGIDKAKLTVLSFGGGQDSTAILHMIEQDEEFCVKYANGRVLVIMSDTGNEHPDTDSHVKRIMEKTHLEFVFITPSMGYHGETWQSLQGSYANNNSIGSKAYPKVCTDRLKIQPIYKFLEDWIEREYGFVAKNKNGFKEFAKHYGKINMIIGIAAGEETRMAGNDDSIITDYKEYAHMSQAIRDMNSRYKEKKKEFEAAGLDKKEVKELLVSEQLSLFPVESSWASSSINMSYPLVELGLDRQGCQDKIAELGHHIPVPSNCIMCPFMDDIELIWLERFLPHEFQKWVVLEDNKFKANEHVGDRNLGVWGKWNKKEDRPYGLRDALADAKVKHGELTDEFVKDHKMSHGHCLMSKY